MRGRTRIFGYMQAYASSTLNFPLTSRNFFIKSLLGMSDDDIKNQVYMTFTTRTGTHENSLNSMKMLLKPHEIHHERCIIGISLYFHIHEKAMKFVSTHEISF